MISKLGRYKKLIRWGLAACCLGYIIWFFVKNRTDLKLVFELDPVTLVGLVCFCTVGHLIYSWRFKFVLKKCSGRSVPFLSWFKIVVLGRFLGLFVPQAGNIYRSISLKKNFAVSYTQYASSLFSFGWLDTCFNLIYAIIVVLAVKPDLRIGPFGALVWLVVITIAVIVVPIVFELAFKLLKFKNRHLSWVHSKLAEMLSVSVAAVRDPVYLSKLVVTGIVAFVNALAIFYLCFRSLGISVHLPSLALFYIVSKLSTQIIVTPGNLGIRELAYGILSDQMGIGMAQGMVVSVIIRILSTSIIIVLGGLFGGIDLLRHRADYSEIQE